MKLALSNLTEDELTQLNDFLCSEQSGEDCLDLIGVHGLFCGLNICPLTLSWENKIELVFGDKPQWSTTEIAQKITSLLQQFDLSISRNLQEGNDIIMPFDLYPDAEEKDIDSPISCWSQAFMEAVFTQEEHWFTANSEADVAEMLLPIMLVSGLFNEEEDINSLGKEPETYAEACLQLPELVIDLYLYFHAPEK